MRLDMCPERGCDLRLKVGYVAVAGGKGAVVPVCHACPCGHHTEVLEYAHSFRASGSASVLMWDAKRKSKIKWGIIRWHNRQCAISKVQEVAP